MRRQRPLLPILLPLLLLLLDGGLCDESPSGHGCTAKSVSRTKCRSDGLQSLVITHYEWNPYLNRCQRKIQLSEVSCNKSKAKRGVCPEPRTVEPGRCNKSNNRQKTLVAHYEPDGKGGCVLRKDYVYPNCPEKKPGGKGRSDGCPEARYYQKPCTGRHRQVFKFYYIRGKAKAGNSSSHDCIEKTSITVEACGAFVPPKKCPSPKVSERGPCKNGYRTLIRTEYSRDPAGKCEESTHSVTESCSEGEVKQPCPPNVLKQGPCVKGLRHITRQYYERTKQTGNRCIRKFSIENRPCGKYKKGVCPKPRVLEPGPCTDGRTRVLVAHYEPDTSTGRCREQRSFTVKTCGKHEASSSSGDKGTGGRGKSAKKEECPDKTYSQGACKKGYRNLFTFTYKYSVDLKRCVKHVALKREQCAALVATEACPSDDTIESGPCKRGFRTSILYHYSRNAEGQCHKNVKKISSPCPSKLKSGCPPKKVTKEGGCKDRIQRWLTVYFEWSKLKGRCVRKFRAREKPCGGAVGGLDSTGATKSKKCPKRRVMEPGPCKDGARKVLVQHYEYSEKKGRCVAHNDFVTQKCGKKAVPKKSTPSIDLNHECPERKVTQGACRKSGYRTVTTVYFVFVKALGRCVRKVKQEDEKCALLVKNVSCPADVTQETGPCVKGYRTNIVYTYKRDLEGRCERQSKKITLACRDKKSKACPPKKVTKEGGCKDRIQRWLTVYFEWSKLKGRCVRKFRAREKPCGGAVGGLDSTGATKSKKCPKRRVMEPGPCKDGARKVLVQHYEYSEKKGRCVAHNDFVTQKCGKKAVPKKSTPSIDLNLECPEKKVTQGACRKSGYRTVSTVYFVFVKALGRCVRKVKQEDEKCALLVKLASCPKDSIVEAGPCTRGFRRNIIYRYSRDLEGRCVRVEKSVSEPCRGNSTDCKPSSRKLEKPCSATGFERWLTTYYVYNKLKKRCVRKLRYKEVSCRHITKCPTPRVIEPSPCRNGKQRLLIEHYELDKKLGRCRMKQDFVNRTCGKPPTKRKAEATKHHCAESVYHQKACREDGYRSVLKIYYRYNAAKGRCVRNVRVDDEKCSRLVAMRASCKADQMVEEGPCKRGFRQNIIYRYERNKDGSCVRKEHRVTASCVPKKFLP